MIYMVIIGLISGVVSGLGIGGGTILIPALTILFSIPQQSAQFINLIYFIPTAIIALFAHIKEGNVNKKLAVKLAALGFVGAVAGAMLAVRLDGEILRKLFGGFLLVMGFIEFRKKDEKDIKEKRDLYGDTKF